MSAAKNYWRTNFVSNVKDKINGHVLVFYFMYAAMKYTLQKLNIPDDKNSGIISLTLAIILSPILFIILIIFRTYRLLVYILLKLVHGKQVLSLLDGTDTIFRITETETSRSVIMNLLLVDHPGSGKEFYETAKEEIMKIFSKDKFKKMHVTKELFMGYYYYRHDDGSYENYINTFLQNEVTSSELQTYLSQVSNVKFPHEDTGMWDVYIGLHKVTDKNAYPIIFRFHHSLGDAATIFNIFSTDFTEKWKKLDDSKDMVLRSRPVVEKSLKESFLNSLVLIDAYDRNALCTSKISGNKEVVWFTDDSSKYIDLIKGIKKRHHGASFVDVMLTAISSSLYNYANKQTHVLPKSITAVVTIMPNLNNTFKYGDVLNYKLANSFTIGMVQLPLKTDVIDKDEDLKRRLNIVCQHYDIMKNKALDIMYNRWLGKVLFSVVPAPIIAPLYKCGQPTILFSNIPGCQHLDIFGGCSVKEFVVFDPNVAVSGISVMITTYENRLNIAFTFDRSIVPTAEDGEQICQNVLRNLERLNNIL